MGTGLEEQPRQLCGFMAALALETVVLRHYERRKQQEIAETSEMLDYLKGN